MRDLSELFAPKSIVWHEEVTVAKFRLSGEWGGGPIGLCGLATYLDDRDWMLRSKTSMQQAILIFPQEGIREAFLNNARPIEKPLKDVDIVCDFHLSQSLIRLDFPMGNHVRRDYVPCGLVDRFECLPQGD